MILAVGDVQAAGHQIRGSAALSSDALQLTLFVAGRTETEGRADGRSQRQPEGLNSLGRQIADIIYARDLIKEYWK